MRTLFHIPLCAFCRKVRLALGEKKLDVRLEVEQVWRRREEFFEINPAGKVPVLIDLNQKVISDSYAITEYLDEAYPEPSLLGREIYGRAETRRLVAWFDDKFNTEVTKTIVFEKTLKRFFSPGGPDSNALRAGKAALEGHLDYICWLADRRNWLAGDEFTLADIAAAAHLSTVDFIGHVPWDKFPEAKQWYTRVKSRPGFRTLLADQMPGVLVAAHYADLDF
ncbi:MAG: glutathione S-transferase family protein [Caedimonas sp.]|jgi:glutathione S-transferase|nr:glutathione S-transferase family protein [Caedimonas sp.]